MRDGACTQNGARDISIGLAARLMHSNLDSIDRDLSMPFTARTTRAPAAHRGAAEQFSRDRRPPSPTNPRSYSLETWCVKRSFVFFFFFFFFFFFTQDETRHFVGEYETEEKGEQVLVKQVG